MIVSDEKCQKALSYLASTDEDAARAKSYLEGLQEQRKTVKAVEFMGAEGSAAQKEQAAYSSVAYQNHLKKIEQAILEFETMRNKRLTAALLVDTWRSCNANRNRGNV